MLDESGSMAGLPFKTITEQTITTLKEKIIKLNPNSRLVIYCYNQSCRKVCGYDKLSNIDMSSIEKALKT